MRLEIGQVVLELGEFKPWIYYTYWKWQRLKFTGNVFRSIFLKIIKFFSLLCHIYMNGDVHMFVGCSDVRGMFRCSRDIRMFVECTDVRAMFGCSWDVRMFVKCSDVRAMFVQCSDVRVMFGCSWDVLMFVGCSDVRGVCGCSRSR